MKEVKAYLLAAFALLTALTSNSQLTGTKNIPGDYATLAVAITDLNTQGVGSGGVTLNLIAGNPQTAPAGGYSITATGTVSNTITITGNSNTITAPTPQPAGNLNDAIFKIIGGDYITIQGFTMLENASNTTTAAGTNNMTEFGVALFYASTTNGAQNNTIQNNTITLNRNYQNTFGIYSNVRHNSTAMTTTADILSPAGSNSNNKIYANIISNVNFGMVFVGSLTGDYMDNGLDVGGNSSATGNTISDYGTTTSFSGYVSVTTTINGINANNQLGLTISYNNITSSAGGVTGTGTIRGIYCQASGTLPATGSYIRTISNNSISVKGGNAANILQGILHDNGNATISLNIVNNDFHDFDHTPATPTGAITFISAGLGSGVQNATISANTFTNMTVKTQGAVTFINKSVTHPANAVLAINNNSIVTQFTKTGAGGTVTGYNSTTGNSPSSATETNSNNNFSNINATGSSIIVWDSRDNTIGGITKTITNNTFTNITGGTGSITVLRYSGGYSVATNYVSGNVISNITGAADIIGLYSVGGRLLASELTGNTVSNLNSTGPNAVTGIIVEAPTNVSKNKIYAIQSSNSAGTATGIAVNIPTNSSATIINNLVGNLTTPLSGGDALTGININATLTNTSVNIYFNTIYLNQASPAGANFGSSGILHRANATATTNTLTLKNNIVVNTSATTGTGRAVAYRRTGTALSNYANASNNNLFYAGTPSATNLIYSDGTNSDQSLAAFQARVGVRDGNSITESPTFLSLAGSSSNFLHVDASVATQIEGGGIAITGVTDDFDGDSRNANYPDIGADEFSGTASDLTGPVIVYTLLGNTTSTADRTIIATITDLSGVATGPNAPRIYYRKGTSGGYSFANATSVSGNDYTFTINYASLSGVVPGDIIQYYLAAQDLPGNIATSPAGGAGTTPPGSTAPAAPNQYKISQAYTWQGATNDFQLATNWSPNRTIPDVSDVLVFDGSVTASTTANNIPRQNVTKLIFQNNITATLDAAIPGDTLMLDYISGQTVLDIQSGSTVNLGTTSAIKIGYGLSQPNQLGNIAGTLNLNQASRYILTNGLTTVSGILSMNGSSSLMDASIATFQFGSGSVLNYAETGGTVPEADYNVNSTINVTGVTASLSFQAVPLGHVVWNCSSQTGAVNVGALTINGSFTLQSTGSGSLNIGGSSIAGNATINGGNLSIPNQAITINGTLVQNGGSMIKTGASAVAWNVGDVNQAGGIINMNGTAGLFSLTATTGNMSFTGTVDGSTSGGIALSFAGTGAQTLNTAGATVLNKVGIAVNKTSGSCTLLSDFTVNNGASVNLINDKLIIAGGKTLTIAAGGVITGAGSNNYVVSGISGANLGKLKYSGLTTSSQTFPIGTQTNYMPVTITPAATGSSFAAGVFEGATENGAPGGTLIGSPDINDIVNAGWQIDNSVVSTTATLNLSWVASQEGSNFTALPNLQIGILRYNGSGYDIATGSGDNAANTATSGFSSFSSFIVGKLSNSCLAGTTSTWTGAIDNDYNKPGNWSTNCVPSATMNIIIPSGSPTLTGGMVSIKNVTIQAGATLNLDNGAILNVKGDFVNDGTIVSGGSPVTGKTIFNGTAAQNIGGTGVYSHVEIDNPLDVMVITDISVKTITVLPGAKLTVLSPKTLNVLQ